MLNYIKQVEIFRVFVKICQFLQKLHIFRHIKPILQNFGKNISIYAKFCKKNQNYQKYRKLSNYQYVTMKIIIETKETAISRKIAPVKSH